MFFIFFSLPYSNYKNRISQDSYPDYPATWKTNRMSCLFSCQNVALIFLQLSSIALLQLNDFFSVSDFINHTFWQKCLSEFVYEKSLRNCTIEIVVWEKKTNLIIIIIIIIIAFINTRSTNASQVIFVRFSFFIIIFIVIIYFCSFLFSSYITHIIRTTF